MYHIRSQQFDLWVGLLSVSVLRKERKSDLKFRQRLSYTDIRLKFTPLSSFGKAFAARLYASTAAGLNVMQNLATVEIVPRYEGIFLDVCRGDVTSVRRRLYNKEASPDSTDKYGHSLITMVRKFICVNTISLSDIISCLIGSFEWKCRTDSPLARPWGESPDC